MAFVLQSDGTYRSSLLEGIDGLTHSFGTRHTGCPPEAVFARQVHSTHVMRASKVEAGSEADALLVADGEQAGVKTADCIPLLLACAESGWAAVVHAGWRGAVDGIGAKAVAAMHHRGARLDRMHAAIGPAIQRCCFEVKHDVSETAHAFFPRTGIQLRERLYRPSGICPSRID